MHSGNLIFYSYILLSILTKNGRAAVRNLELSAIKPEFTISILSLSGYFVWKNTEWKRIYDFWGIKKKNISEHSRTCLYQDLRLFFDSQTSAAVQLLSLKWNVTSNKRFHVCFCLRLNKNLFTDTSGLVSSDHVGVFATCYEVAKARWWNQSGGVAINPKGGNPGQEVPKETGTPTDQIRKRGTRHRTAPQTFCSRIQVAYLTLSVQINRIPGVPCLWSDLPDLL